MTKTNSWMVKFITTSGLKACQSVGLPGLREIITARRKDRKDAVSPTRPLLPWALQFAFDRFEATKKNSSNKDMRLVSVTLERKKIDNKSGSRSAGGVGV